MTTSSFLSGPGDNSYRVPLELFRENRQKLVERLHKKLVDEPAQKNGNSEQTRRYLVVLKGGPSPTRYDTDHEPIFRQESYFWWLTGVKEPDCALIVIVDEEGESDSSDGNINHRYALFVPRLPESYATIMGKIRTLDEWRELYGVDDGVHFADTLEEFVDEQAQQETNTKVLLLCGPNSDSGAMYEDLTPTFPRLLPKVPEPEASGESLVLDSVSSGTTTIDKAILFPILAECRVFKSHSEMALMQHVTMITSFAHAYVMRNVKPGMFEYQCESLFRHYGYYNYGSRLVSYTSICGCGPNSAILHYGHTGEPNSRRIEETDHCLFDMGAEYQCYASDVTCSFPANGTFTKKYRAIYESVLNAQRAVIAMMEPGVSWVECHIAAELEIVKGLYAVGVLRMPPDEAAEESMGVLERLVRDHRLGAVFMPHGLGHLIGIDTHDVGGYLEGTPPRSPKPGLRSLRTARILQECMVLTVEPGCYFIDHLLDEAMQEGNPLAPYLNRELIDAEYRGYGGVRLEDVVAVTAKTPCGGGHSCVQNFTLCPRTVSEVEMVMAGGKWPPVVDEAPELRRILLTEPWSPLPAPPSR